MASVVFLTLKQKWKMSFIYNQFKTIHLKIKQMWQPWHKLVKLNSYCSAFCVCLSCDASYTDQDLLSILFSLKVKAHPRNLKFHIYKGLLKYCQYY